MLPWRNGPKCALDDFYLTERGYYPSLSPLARRRPNQWWKTRWEKRQAVALTLDP